MELAGRDWVVLSFGHYFFEEGNFRRIGKYIRKADFNKSVFLVIDFVVIFAAMLTLPLFMSGAEIAFVMFILVMVFGADKIPEIAKGLGKGMRSIKNATDDIKNEVMKSADKHGMETKGMADDVKKEVDKVKEDIEEITGSVKRRF